MWVTTRLCNFEIAKTAATNRSFDVGTLYLRRHQAHHNQHSLNHSHTQSHIHPPHTPHGLLSHIPLPYASYPSITIVQATHTSHTLAHTQPQPQHSHIQLQLYSHSHSHLSRHRARARTHTHIPIPIHTASQTATSHHHDRLMTIYTVG